jgi:hypothetical protein
MRTGRRSLLSLMVLAALVLPLSGIARASTTNAEIGVYAQPMVKTAHVGDRVFFNAIGFNAGPDDIVNDSLDTQVLKPVGLKVRRMRCLGGISPDTPFCEFGPVFAGGFTVTQVRTRITGATASGLATLRFCVSNEAGTLAGNDPSNDCMTARVHVVA